MREEHFVNLKGRRHVLYGGLLAMAHEDGLHEIHTELLQIPTEENGNVAIVKARVVMERNSGYQTFEGIGDASPANVGKMIAPHSIRHAETRAKARALRDAVNAAEAVLEGEEPNNRPADTIENESEAVEAVREGRPETTPGGATRKAAGKLWHLVGGKNGADEWQKINGKIEEMSAKRVSDWIRELS